MNLIHMALVFFLIASAGYVSSDQLDYNELIQDLNGNGIEDYISVVTLPHGRRLIVLEEGVDNSSRLFIGAINMGVNMTSFNDIEINPSQVISIFSGCDVCGRDAFIVEHKIIHRNDRYILAGVTQIHIDRVNASTTICDVNLLTGQAEMTVDDKKINIQTVDRSISFSEVSIDYVPSVCESY